MDIKVLGPGCPKCQQTEKIVKEAVAETGVDAQVEKVTDTMKIAGYGVFGTPSVVIDGAMTISASCISGIVKAPQVPIAVRTAPMRF